MNYITSTELRTKTPSFIEALLAGEEINLIHRSKIIGTFKPKKIDPKLFDADAVMKITAKMHHPILSEKERDKRYRTAMMEKHGKYISRH